MDGETGEAPTVQQLTFKEFRWIQIRSRVDGRADLYSLGALLREFAQEVASYSSDSTISLPVVTEASGV